MTAVHTLGSERQFRKNRNVNKLQAEEMGFLEAVNGCTYQIR
jgi:hypothetical protein